MEASIVLNLVCHLVAGELLHLDNSELGYRAIVDEVVQLESWCEIKTFECRKFSNRNCCYCLGQERC